MIWKINKLENLKIIQGGDPDNTEIQKKITYDTRRGSSGISNIYHRNDLKFDEGSKRSKYLINNKSVYLNDTQNINILENDNSFSRQQNIINQNSNAFSNDWKIINSKLNLKSHDTGIHIHDSQRINDGMNPYNSKMVDKMKKHRRDLKSGDHAK